MKKIIIILLSLLCLSACSSDYKIYKTYKKYYQELLKQDDLKSNSLNFTLELVENELKEGLRFDVIIDEPKIEMYNIVALLIVDNGNYDEENMMPSLGIFDEKYHLIPNEVNLDEYKAKGLNLSIVLDERTSFRLLIQYDDKDGHCQKEYLIIGN